MKKVLLVFVFFVLNSIYVRADIHSTASAPCVENSVEINSGPPLPDLVIEAIYLVSQSDSFAVVISNIGTASLPEGTAFSVEGVVTSSQAGEPFQHTFVLYFSEGLEPGETLSLIGSVTGQTFQNQPGETNRKKPSPIRVGKTEDDPIPPERPADTDPRGKGKKSSNASPINLENFVRINATINTNTVGAESNESNNSKRTVFMVVQ